MSIWLLVFPRLRCETLVGVFKKINLMPIISKTLTLEISIEQFLNNCSPLELQEIDLLIQSDFYQKKMTQKCRVCGCTDYDCRQCIERTGEPCYWVEPDLCSACANSQSQNKIEHGRH